MKYTHDYLFSVFKFQKNKQRLIYPHVWKIIFLTLTIYLLLASGEISQQNKRKSEKSKVKSVKKSKKQTAVERAIRQFTEYQKESDQAFLRHTAEQATVEADLRNQELKAFKGFDGVTCRSNCW